ncbi:glycine cleavage system protein GcvH [Aeromicrobium sp. P5_D10]
MSIPADLKYTADHEWVRLDGDTAIVGITAYAAEALGDVVYLELPEIGASITHGVACGEIESTKSVSDLLAPADGEVVGINADIVDDPGAVNTDPYGAGWLISIRVTGALELLSPEQYASLTGAGA